MYTPEQIALAQQHNLQPAVLMQKVYHWDGSRPTVEEILTGRQATAPSEAPDNNEFALASLLEIVIPETESTVGELLEIDSPTARATLAYQGIHHESGMLHLNLAQDLLLRLLISPLLREPGTRLDPRTGTLSIPLSIA